MLDLYGKPLPDNTITFRKFGTMTTDIAHVSKMPWPTETAVSAGNGVVFCSDGSTYETLFMEVYPPGASFIRGEGATPQECEDSCWAQYLRSLRCPSGGEHEYEARGYRNGGGFCKHCNTFKSEAFTAEELGQYCHVCGVATKWHWDVQDDDTVLFSCEKHVPDPTRRLFADEDD